MPARRPAKPAPARRTPRPPPDEGAHETGAVAYYRVLSGGVSTPAGAMYRGAVVTAEELGDADRITALLAKGAIEEVADHAD